MKHLLLTLALIATPAYADNPTPAPQFDGEHGVVPDPVPVGYPYCLRVVWKKEYWHRVKASVYLAPHTRKDIDHFNGVRRLEMGKIVHCQSSDT